MQRQQGRRRESGVHGEHPRAPPQSGRATQHRHRRRGRGPRPNQIARAGDGEGARPCTAEGGGPLEPGPDHQPAPTAHGAVPAQRPVEDRQGPQAHGHQRSWALTRVPCRSPAGGDGRPRRARKSPARSRRHRHHRSDHVEHGNPPVGQSVQASWPWRRARSPPRRAGGVGVGPLDRSDAVVPGQRVAHARPVEHPRAERREPRRHRVPVDDPRPLRPGRRRTRAARPAARWCSEPARHVDVGPAVELQGVGDLEPAGEALEPRQPPGLGHQDRVQVAPDDLDPPPSAPVAATHRTK